MDIFASRHLAHLKRYMSWRPDSDAVKTDALSLPKQCHIQGGAQGAQTFPETYVLINKSSVFCLSYHIATVSLKVVIFFLGSINRMVTE